ncbi:MAG: hypothetical protein K2J20_01195 [Bacilli bacterium]|nr:hypothetical protein [Bacilli bacterium]
MNQKRDLLNLKRRLISLLLAGACMVGLSGCCDRSIYIGNNSVRITYTGEDIGGSINYSAIEKYIRIVTFSQDGVTFRRLVAIREYNTTYTNRNKIKTVDYYDVESGALLLEYEDNLTDSDIERKYNYGGNLVVVNEREYLPFLFQIGNIQYDYDVSYLVSFYHECVEPELAKEESLALN